VLRITEEVEADSMSLRLEGRVEGAWVRVLREAWLAALGRSTGRKLVVDLRAVNFSDQEGRALLLEMQKKGAELVKASGFMREILTDLHDEKRKGD
jgi:anti-anti-sigma regulatory factor